MRSFYDSPDWTAFCPGHPGGESATRRLLERAGLPSGGRVLDLCCGRGDSLRLLGRLGFHCAGIDRESVVSSAQLKYPELPFSIWEGGPLLFGDGYFDAVLCECSLSQLNQGDGVFPEVCRILADGGLFLVSDIYEGEEPPAFPGFERLWIENAARDLREFAARWLWETGRLFPYEGRGVPSYFHVIFKKSGGFQNGL